MSSIGKVDYKWNTIEWRQQQEKAVGVHGQLGSAWLSSSIPGIINEFTLGSHTARQWLAEWMDE